MKIGNPPAKENEHKGATKKETLDGGVIGNLYEVCEDDQQPDDNAAKKTKQVGAQVGMFPRRPQKGEQARPGTKGNEKSKRRMSTVFYLQAAEHSDGGKHGGRKAH